VSNNPPQPSAELSRLLVGFTEDQLNDRERARVADLLREEPGAKEYYVDYMVLHSMLRAEYASPLDLPVVKEPGKSPLLGFLGSSFEQGVNYLCQPRSLSVASWVAMGWATVALLLFVVILSRNTREDAGVLPTASRVAQQASIAWFAADEKCQWSAAENAPLLGSPLGVGQRFQLKSGLSQIHFNNGVGIIVEGPASFELLSSMRISLYSGKITANVPEAGIGFCVDTPTVSVIDLGTEFGVSTDESGATEVSCFVGAVELESRPEETQAEQERPLAPEKIVSQKIIAGEAVRVECPGQVKTRQLKADTKEFVRSMPPSALLPTVNVDFEPMGNPLYSGSGACPRGQGKHWNSIGLVNRRCGPLWSGERHIGSVTIEISRNQQALEPFTTIHAATGHALADDYIAVKNDDGSFTLGGLRLNARYDLYLYGTAGAAQGPQNQLFTGASEGSLFTVGGKTKATKGLRRRERPFMDGKDYVVFSGIRSDENGEIRGTWKNNPSANSPFNTNPIGPFNGLQLVGPLLRE